MVTFIGRMQVYWPGRRGVGGCGVLLVTGGSEYGNMFVPARSVAAAVFKTLGRRFVGMAGVADTDAVGVVENDAAVADVRALANAVLGGK